MKTAYVNKYWETRCIYAVELQNTTNDNLFRVVGSAYYHCIREGDDFEFSYEAAKAKVEQLRQKKILQTKRKLAKLEAMRF